MRLQPLGQAFLSALRLAHRVSPRPLGARPHPTASAQQGPSPSYAPADGTVTHETYPQTREFNGGFCVLDLPSREAALEWAARIAKSCRCSQELRQFQDDPES